VPLTKRFIAGHPIDIGWVKSECVPHAFGELPTGATAAMTSKAPTTFGKKA
jgi:xanthosine utilization system XapX-like protein